MFSPGSIFVSILAGSVGTGYFVYGKKQGRALLMFDGAALCIYPWFVDRVWLLVVVGAVLAALPFVLDRA
jgi:hypothetical protein